MSDARGARRQWRTFRAGAAAGDIFELFFRHFGPIVGVTTLMFLPTLVYSVYAVRRILTEGVEHLQQLDAASVVVALLQMLVIQPLANAVLCLALFHALQDKPITFGESAGAGLRRLLATIGVLLLQMLAYAAAGIAVVLVCIALGAVLTLVSQVLAFAAVIVAVFAGMIACLSVLITFYVAVPAVVIEGITPLQAMRRSATLTRNLRWGVFLLLVIVGLVGFGFGVLTGVLQAGLIFQDPVRAAWVSVVIQEILTLLMTALGAVAMTVCYFHLRCAKEGLDVETMTAAFDEEVPSR